MSLAEELRAIANRVDSLESEGLVDLKWLAGASEIASILMVNKSTVHRWIERSQSTGFPSPVLTFVSGHIWNINEVVKWYAAWTGTRRD